MTTHTETIDETAAVERDDLIELFREMEDVGSVELKMNVAADQRIRLQRLNVDFLQGKIREVYFFDTPDLTLFQHGVVPRARRTQGALDDTVVKLRPVQLAALEPEVRSSPNLKVEMDITKDSYVVSASLKGERPVGSVHQVTRQGKSIEKLFTKEQRSFFQNHCPAGVGWTDLVPLGPAYVVFLKYVPPEFARKLTIEQWHYPGEIPLLELSTKTKPGKVMSVRAEAAAFLDTLGLTPSGEQHPKTRKALEFFAGSM